MPLRAGRRNRTNQTIVEPLRDCLDDTKRERLARALALVSGTEAMIVLIDAVQLAELRPPPRKE